MRPYLPSMVDGGCKSGHFVLSAGSQKVTEPPHLPLIQLRNGLMDPLTGQRERMQMDGKPC